MQGNFVVLTLHLIETRKSKPTKLSPEIDIVYHISPSIFEGHVQMNLRRLSWILKNARHFFQNMGKKSFSSKEIFSPDLKRTIAFRQANSASLTCRLLKRELISCRRRISAIVATIFSAGVLSTCMPADARSGATSSGIDHWTAPRTNNSLQASSNSITWSRNGRFTNEGMFRAHLTDMKSRRAALSQIASGVEQYRDELSSCWWYWKADCPGR